MTGKREKTAALSKGRQQGGLQKAALYFWKHKYLYLMLLPAILYYIIFCYVPMYGVTIAFKDFNPMLGIWKSPWAGTEMFQKLFGMEKFYSVFWNTIRISLIRLIFGFPFPIIIALLLNELRLGKVKRVIQTAIYIPNFISWVVLGGILTSLLSMDSGIVNGVIKALGFAPIGFLTDEKYFVGTMVVSMIWKTFGWNTIINLPAGSGKSGNSGRRTKRGSAAVRGGDRGRGEPVAEAVTYHIAVYPFYYYRCADYENRRTDAGGL